MPKRPMNQTTLLRAAAGDPPAEEALFYALARQFKRTALSCCRGLADPNTSAEEALHTAYLRLLGSVSKGTFSWKGEPHLCSYFKRAVQCACMDHHRAYRLERAWLDKHAVASHIVDREGNEAERVEILPDPRADELLCEEEALQRGKTCLEALSLLQSRLNGSNDHRFLEACTALAEVPGSHQWPCHQRTSFVKENTGLDGNAFYVAHSRFRTKAKQVAEEVGTPVC
jgi:DNA-directed RNA polymerase specialized sigma24 family protein